MGDIHEINMDCFNNPELINKLNWEDLVKLACIATSPGQLDQIAQANNVNAKVATAIIAHPKVKLDDIAPRSLLNLARISSDIDELCKIVKVANVW